MDFDNLIADTEDILAVHYSEGRQGHTIDKVIVHYNDGNLSVDDCYRVWQYRPASAHYQVEESGRIGQLVWDANTSWNCGKWVPNCESIGIEHANRSDGTISDACLDAGAHLVAAICKKYGLGRPEWLTNVFPHCYFVATSCPGEIYGSQKDTYIASAQRWYDSMTGTTPTPAPDPTPAPSTDGSVGNLDGETGELLVDGDFGPITIKDVQRTMQFYGLYQGCVVDGSFGTLTAKALQTYLQRKGYYQGCVIDGSFGGRSVLALQQYTKDLGYYWSVVDGVRQWCILDGSWGAETTKALQRALNSERF